MTDSDLIDLLEDVEHVILGVEGTLAVLEAAKRSERAVTTVASGDLSAQMLSEYASQRGISIEEACRTSLFVGASAADAQAAARAGIRCAVVADMEVLAEALNARWDEKWCSWQGCC